MCCIFTLAMPAAHCLADDADILRYIPEILNSCPDCKPRLTIVNNCADNAELLWKVTGNPQWDFLVNQGAAVLYTGNNKTGDKFYKFTLGAQGSANAQKTFLIPDKGASSGSLYFMLGCTPNPGSDWDQCEIGGVPFTPFFGALPLYEPTFGCASSITNRSLCAVNRTNQQPLTAIDWFDLSAVDYYALPFNLELVNSASYSCTASTGPLTGIDASMLDLASCPSEDSTTMTMTPADQTTYAATYALMTAQGGFSLLSTGSDTSGSYNKVCAASGQWLKTPGIGNPPNTAAMPTNFDTINTADWYSAYGQGGVSDLYSTACTSPGCGGPQTYKGILGNYTKSLPQTNYIRRLKEMGYTAAYSWAYDDAAGDMNCQQGVKTVLTLCPKGGAPYSQATRWWYNTASGVNACVFVDGATPGGATQYASLFECQRDGIARYAIFREQLTSHNPNMLSQNIYYCTTHPATGDGVTTYDYATCQTNVSLCNTASLPDSGTPVPGFCPTS